MRKLIDADALKAVLMEISKPGSIGEVTAMIFCGVIDEQPEAVVKCRDCKNYEFACNRVPEEQTWYCYMWDCETGCEDFCSYGERRTDETN